MADIVLFAILIFSLLNFVILSIQIYRSGKVLKELPKIRKKKPEFYKPVVRDDAFFARKERNEWGA